MLFPVLNLEIKNGFETDWIGIHTNVKSHCTLLIYYEKSSEISKY